MIIYKAFKFRIYPNKQQQEFFEKHFGCSRFVYNYFLKQRIDFYEKNKKQKKKGLTYFDNCKELTHLKKQKEFIWLQEISHYSLRGSLRNLDKAYKNFFKKTGKFPKFKKKSISKQSFTVDQNLSLAKNILNIPKIHNIKIKISRSVEGEMKSVTISKTPSGKYFASIMCKIEIPEPKYEGKTIGIDFGLKSFITTSKGKTVTSPKYLQEERRMKRLQRRVSRKVKGSNNKKKAIKRFAIQHEKIANKRRDFLHKLSQKLISKNQAIYLENLAIQNMVKNHHLAKSISSSGWHNFVTMLEYKGQWYGCYVGKIDRFYPSSKTCSNCGYVKKDLKLADRKWQCPECKSIHNRDINAAKNILRVGSGRSELNACGEGSSVFGLSPSGKQEIS